MTSVLLTTLWLLTSNPEPPTLVAGTVSDAQIQQQDPASRRLRLGTTFDEKGETHAAGGDAGTPADLRDAAERLGDDRALDKAVLLLGAANLQLSVSAEPGASRVLLGIATANDFSDWQTATLEARAHLESARQLWDDVPEPATEMEEGRFEQVEEWFEILEAFERAFSALSRAPGGEDEGLTDAAIALSGFLESANKDLAQAAALWQAALLRRLGRPDRATQVLALPLSPPGPSPFALFIRLERLECLADGGDVEAAMVLALRMEEACREWYPGNELRRLEARRACNWMRAILCRKKLSELDSAVPSEDVDAWHELCAQVRDLLKAEDEEGTITVARLGRAMPVVVNYRPLLALDAPGDDGPPSEAINPRADLTGPERNQVTPTPDTDTDDEDPEDFTEDEDEP